MHLLQVHYSEVCDELLMFLMMDHAKGIWAGGMFWDGRATGWRLGDPLAEQALGPFLNPLEQNLHSPSEVVDRVSVSSYGGLFNTVCGGATTDSAKYDCIGRAIAAYEMSADVTSFTSMFDLGKLTKQEKDGLALFRGKGKCDRFYNEPLFNPLGVAWVVKFLNAISDTHTALPP